MKLLTFILLLLTQYSDLKEIRELYQKAALDKAAAKTLDQRMLAIDSNAIPVLYGYKGANEMVQAKYALNPVIKLEKFNRGKTWLTQAFNRDTLDLEIRFIRYTIQTNLPSFLGYREDIGKDKIYLLQHAKDCPDPELKKMIDDYLTAYKQRKN